MNKNKTKLREALLRVEELETYLEILAKEKASDEKQIKVQKKVIQELRKSRDNSVDLNEFQSLRNELNSCLDKLAESQLKVDSLAKRLATEQNEIEFLHNKNEVLSNEIQELKNKLSSFKTTIEDQNHTILEMNSFRENYDYYRKHFENTLAENLELRQLLEIYKNEEIKDDNISVDDFNHSMVKFLDSLDGNPNEGTFDSVFDIKLMDIEKALEEKKKFNEDLKHKTNLMNEEIRKLNDLRLEFENRVTHIRSDSNQSYLKQKQSFDKVFDLIEDKLLSHIPLNQYFVPLSRKVIFSVTPGLVINVFRVFESFY